MSICIIGDHIAMLGPEFIIIFSIFPTPNVKGGLGLQPLKPPSPSTVPGYRQDLSLELIISAVRCIPLPEEGRHE